MNKVGRFDIAQDALRGILAQNPQHSVAIDAHSLISQYQHKNRELEKYALEHGEGQSSGLAVWLCDLKLMTASRPCGIRSYRST